MKWQTEIRQYIKVGDNNLECQCWGPAPDKASTIVLVHEGLGCVGLWKDFPVQLHAATGCGIFAYSRLGYGHSDAVILPRPLDYMTREAVDILPVVLDEAGIERTILIGHSDGASIATIYAGSFDDPHLGALCLIAPHFFTEPSGLQAIRQARIAYESGPLRPRLARHHGDADNAFYGWNDAWLAPGFKDWNLEMYIPKINVPVLALQGADDQYGTLAQIESLKKHSKCPLESVVLEGCKHSPHNEKPAQTLALIADFIARN